MLPDAFCRLADLLSGRRTLVITGAGCSTESGIPDYRTEDGQLKTPEPIRYIEFVRRPEARRRYWSRSAVGWPRMARAEPNPAHEALARLERSGPVTGVVTQNVDGLHQAAGSDTVVELHGNLDRVLCLGCGASEERARVQERLLEDNPVLVDRAPPDDAEIAPDGDARLSPEVAEGFRVPDCRACGGTLKPDVVFFGESVPPERVASAWRLYEEAEVLLVAGSSLSVWSGYRFVDRAAGEGLPVAIVNVGSTRGDEDARVRVSGRVGSVLPALARELIRPDAA